MTTKDRWREKGVPVRAEVEIQGWGGTSSEGRDRKVGPKKDAVGTQGKGNYQKPIVRGWVYQTGKEKKPSRIKRKKKTSGNRSDGRR